MHLLKLHFKNEILEDVYCGFCSWKQFRFKVQVALKKVEQTQPPQKIQAPRTKSEKGAQKKSKPKSEVEVLQRLLQELDRISKYDIKEVDRLGKTSYLYNQRNLFRKPAN
jgi:hypothetical protein